MGLRTICDIPTELVCERINSSGGLAGRMIEMVTRDSKGQPREAERVARELVNADGCEIGRRAGC
jgi:branched-chain amino acid transport system substrate-binding protein